VNASPALLDPGSPFLEFCQLAGDGMYDGVPPYRAGETVEFVVVVEQERQPQF
jgi:hypothetical protein